MELAEVIKKFEKSTSDISVEPSRRGEVTHYIADITQAKTILGYKPTTPFADGIVKTVEWYKANT